MTLVEFLRARLRDRASDARNAGAMYDPSIVLAEVDAKRRIVEWHERTDCQGHPAPHPPYQPHGPGVCTYECVTCAEPYPCKTLRLLALPYADHPDYDESWRP